MAEFIFRKNEIRTMSAGECGYQNTPIFITGDIHARKWRANTLGRYTESLGTIETDRPSFACTVKIPNAQTAFRVNPTL